MKKLTSTDAEMKKAFLTKKMHIWQDFKYVFDVFTARERSTGFTLKTPCKAEAIYP